jgi:hypothetical protein
VDAGILSIYQIFCGYTLDQSDETMVSPKISIPALESFLNKRLTTGSFTIMVLILAGRFASHVTSKTAAAGIAGIIFGSTFAVHLFMIIMSNATVTLRNSIAMDESLLPR